MSHAGFVRAKVIDRAHEDRHYWAHLTRARLDRRRVLAGLLTAGAAALGLAGCGSPRGRGTPASEGRPEGLLSFPEDTTAGARTGGVFKGVSHVDVSTFDVLAAGSVVVYSLIAAYTYPRLVKFAAAKYPGVARGEIEGDLAESFEFSPDKLQLTFRLRQGLKWESRAPTNGRQVDAQDVLFSWNKFARVSPLRGDLLYQAESAPGSPVDSVTSPDPRTVVVKLKQPDVSIAGLFASERLFCVMPRESESGFDPRVEVRGYGPWLMTENRTSAFRVWTRNPDYYVKGRPFFDSIETPIIADYTARLAQFKAGNVWTGVVGQDDVIATKRELPHTLLRQAELYATAPSTLAFGYEGDSPWRDERLRQAVSHLLDRETLINVATNRSRYSTEGLPVDVRYHTVVGAGWEGYWLDPKDARFGSSGKYYGYDPAEARRLLAAGGYPDGVDTFLHFNGGGQYGAVYTRTAELVSGMLSEGGVRARLDPRDYQNDWLPNYQYGYALTQNVGRAIRGFPGIVFRVAQPYPTVAAQLFSTLHKDGTRFEGMTPDGKSAQLGDPEVNQALVTIRREFDGKRQQDLVQDLARLMARKAYSIPNPPFSVLGFNLSWPVIGNLGVYRGWPGGSAVTEANIHLWIDSSKPPLARTS